MDDRLDRGHWTATMKDPPLTSRERIERFSALFGVSSDSAWGSSIPSPVSQVNYPLHLVGLLYPPKSAPRLFKRFRSLPDILGVIGVPPCDPISDPVIPPLCPPQVRVEDFSVLLEEAPDSPGAASHLRSPISFSSSQVVVSSTSHPSLRRRLRHWHDLAHLHNVEPPSRTRRSYRQGEFGSPYPSFEIHTSPSQTKLVTS
jgi:hypothetical protein